MTGQDFERSIVHAFNDYFDTNKTRAIAYRHLQMRYQPQLFDVLVDSRANELYLAIECKSVDTSTVPGLYFKKHFTWKSGVCQVRRESSWLTKSGRNGFLVVEARRPKPARHCALSLFPGARFIGLLHSEAIIHQEQITYGPCVEKSRKYTLDDEFITDLVKYLDSYPKSVKGIPKKRSR